MEKIQDVFGRHIRRLRRHRDLTQEALAERTGLHPTYISRLEGGKALPSLSVILSLAAGLEVRPSELLLPFDAGHGADHHDTSSAEAIALLLEGCSASQLALVKDFTAMIRERGHLRD